MPTTCSATGSFPRAITAHGPTVGNANIPLSLHQHTEEFLDATGVDCGILRLVSSVLSLSNITDHSCYSVTGTCPFAITVQKTKRRTAIIRPKRGTKFRPIMFPLEIDLWPPTPLRRPPSWCPICLLAMEGQMAREDHPRDHLAVTCLRVRYAQNRKFVSTFRPTPRLCSTATKMANLLPISDISNQVTTENLHG